MSTAITGSARHRDRAEHGAHPDPAAAEHGDALARPHARRAPHRADPGRDRAADHRRHLQRHVVRDRHAAGGGHDGVVGERRQQRVVVDRLAGAREPRGPVQQAPGGHRVPRRRAQVRQVAQALVAAPARRQPGEHHVRPRRGQRHARPGRLDDARALVAEHRRHADRSVPSIAFRSEWQTPPARSRTRTSPGPGRASSSASTAGALPTPSRTAARILSSPLLAPRVRPAAAAAARAAPRPGSGSARSARARPP